MRISILQTALQWEAPAANRRMLGEKLALLAGQTDLVVLPEMFTTGFSMQAAALAEPMDGETLHWMLDNAQAIGAAITGSFICRENGQYFNRLVWMFPDGTFQTYDKRHLFTLAGEHEHYTPGHRRITVEWKGWRICPLICYDLRFPVWSRNNPPQNPYDLLLYVANWPNRRAHHWQVLLSARAIENQAYLAGVNLVGQDGNGHEYSGDSCILDYHGQAICRISGKEGAFTAELSLAELQEYRARLPFLQDGDTFQLL